jgi:hypothetical protein
LTRNIFFLVFFLISFLISSFNIKLFGDWA